MVRGNLIELAVAFVFGAAFATLMQALVADLVTPIVAAIFGEPSFDDLSFTINGSEFLYGHFLNALLTFLSIAAAIYFFVVLPYEKLQEDQGITPETKACEHCLSPSRSAPIAARSAPAGRARGWLTARSAQAQTPGGAAEAVALDFWLFGSRAQPLDFHLFTPVSISHIPVRL